MAHPWDAKVHGPWLEALDRARATQGLCKFCMRLRDQRKGKYPNTSSKRGVDIARKRALHTALITEGGGECSTCKRIPHSEFEHPIGFHFNHRESRWHGDTKKMNISDFWVDWAAIDASPYKDNSRYLNMTLEEAEPLMRAEALKCDVVCSTCHERITQGQLTDAKGTVYK